VPSGELSSTNMASQATPLRARSSRRTSSATFPRSRKVGTITDNVAVVSRSGATGTLGKTLALVRCLGFAVKGLDPVARIPKKVSQLELPGEETLAGKRRCWLVMTNLVMPTGPATRLPDQHGVRLLSPRVLVVEDEITVAMLIEDMVGELSYEVAAVVPRLDDAMRLVDSDSFDLAMLDVHLNGETVFPFAAALAQRDIPFLFATAYGPRGIPEEFRDRPVLQKPFGPVELGRALLELSVVR